MHGFASEIVHPGFKSHRDVSNAEVGVPPSITFGFKSHRDVSNKTETSLRLFREVSNPIGMFQIESQRFARAHSGSFKSHRDVSNVLFHGFPLRISSFKSHRDVSNSSKVLSIYFMRVSNPIGMFQIKTWRLVCVVVLCFKSHRDVSNPFLDIFTQKKGRFKSHRDVSNPHPRRLHPPSGQFQIP